MVFLFVFLQNFSQRSLITEWESGEFEDMVIIYVVTNL